jgi:hypothetical protein
MKYVIGFFARMFAGVFGIMFGLKYDIIKTLPDDLYAISLLSLMIAGMLIPLKDFSLK